MHNLDRSQLPEWKILHQRSSLHQYQTAPKVQIGPQFILDATSPKSLSASMQWVYPNGHQFDNYRPLKWKIAAASIPTMESIFSIILTSEIVMFYCYRWFFPILNIPNVV